MTDSSLIVARMEPGAAADVARLFGASDATALPLDLGVVRRHLFHYHGLYFHYVEFDADARAQVGKARGRADFQRLSADLDPYVKPFDPATWNGPADAMATEFYRWERRS